MGCASFTGVAARLAVAARLVFGFDRLAVGDFAGLIASPPPAPRSRPCKIHQTHQANRCGRVFLARNDIASTVASMMSLATIGAKDPSVPDAPWPAATGGCCPRRAQHCVQRIAVRSLQPAPIHAVVVLQVSDGRLHRLASLQPAALLICQAFELAPVDDLNAGLAASTPRKPRSTTTCLGAPAVSSLRIRACSSCSCNVWPS